MNGLPGNFDSAENNNDTLIEKLGQLDASNEHIQYAIELLQQGKQPGPNIESYLPEQLKHCLGLYHCVFDSTRTPINQDPELSEVAKIEEELDLIDQIKNIFGLTEKQDELLSGLVIEGERFIDTPGIPDIDQYIGELTQEEKKKMDKSGIYMNTDPQFFTTLLKIGQDGPPEYQAMVGKLINQARYGDTYRPVLKDVKKQDQTILDVTQQTETGRLLKTIFDIGTDYHLNVKAALQQLSNMIMKLMEVQNPSRLEQVLAELTHKHIALYHLQRITSLPESINILQSLKAALNLLDSLFASFTKDKKDLFLANFFRKIPWRNHDLQIQNFIDFFNTKVELSEELAREVAASVAIIDAVGNKHLDYEKLLEIEQKNGSDSLLIKQIKLKSKLETLTKSDDSKIQRFLAQSNLENLPHEFLIFFLSQTKDKRIWKFILQSLINQNKIAQIMEYYTPFLDLNQNQREDNLLIKRTYGLEQSTIKVLFNINDNRVYEQFFSAIRSPNYRIYYNAVMIAAFMIEEEGDKPSFMQKLFEHLFQTKEDCFTPSLLTPLRIIRHHIPENNATGLLVHFGAYIKMKYDLSDNETTKIFAYINNEKEASTVATAPVLESPPVINERTKPPKQDQSELYRAKAARIQQFFKENQSGYPDRTNQIQDIKEKFLAQEQKDISLNDIKGLSTEQFPLIKVLSDSKMAPRSDGYALSFLIEDPARLYALINKNNGDLTIRYFDEKNKEIAIKSDNLEKVGKPLGITPAFFQELHYVCLTLISKPQTPGTTAEEIKQAVAEMVENTPDPEYQKMLDEVMRFYDQKHTLLTVASPKMVPLDVTSKKLPALIKIIEYGPPQYRTVASKALFNFLYKNDSIASQIKTLQVYQESILNNFDEYHSLWLRHMHYWKRETKLMKVMQSFENVILMQQPTAARPYIEIIHRQIPAMIQMIQRSEIDHPTDFSLQQFASIFYLLAQYGQILQTGKQQEPSQQKCFNVDLNEQYTFESIQSLFSHYKEDTAHIPQENWQHFIGRVNEAYLSDEEKKRLDNLASFLYCADTGPTNKVQEQEIWNQGVENFVKNNEFTAGDGDYIDIQKLDLFLDKARLQTTLTPEFKQKMQRYVTQLAQHYFHIQHIQRVFRAMHLIIFKQHPAFFRELLKTYCDHLPIDTLDLKDLLSILVPLPIDNLEAISGGLKQSLSAVITERLPIDFYVRLCGRALQEKNTAVLSKLIDVSLDSQCAYQALVVNYNLLSIEKAQGAFTTMLLQRVFSSPQDFLIPHRLDYFYAIIPGLPAESQRHLCDQIVRLPGFPTDPAQQTMIFNYLAEAAAPLKAALEMKHRKEHKEEQKQAQQLKLQQDHDLLQARLDLFQELLPKSELYPDRTADIAHLLNQIRQKRSIMLPAVWSEVGFKSPSNLTDILSRAEIKRKVEKVSNEDSLKCSMIFSNAQGTQLHCYLDKEAKLTLRVLNPDGTPDIDINTNNLNAQNRSIQSLFHELHYLCLDIIYSAYVRAEQIVRESLVQETVIDQPLPVQPPSPAVSAEPLVRKRQQRNMTIDLTQEDQSIRGMRGKQMQEKINENINKLREVFQPLSEGKQLPDLNELTLDQQSLITELLLYEQVEVEKYTTFSRIIDPRRIYEAIRAGTIQPDQIFVRTWRAHSQPLGFVEYEKDISHIPLPYAEEIQANNLIPASHISYVVQKQPSQEAAFRYDQFTLDQGGETLQLNTERKFLNFRIDTNDYFAAALEQVFQDKLSTNPLTEEQKINLLDFFTQACQQLENEKASGNISEDICRQRLQEIEAAHRLFSLIDSVTRMHQEHDIKNRHAHEYKRHELEKQITLQAKTERMALRKKYLDIEKPDFPAYLQKIRELEQQLSQVYQDQTSELTAEKLEQDVERYRRKNSPVKISIETVINPLDPSKPTRRVTLELPQYGFESHETFNQGRFETLGAVLQNSPPSVKEMSRKAKDLMGNKPVE